MRVLSLYVAACLVAYYGGYWPEDKAFNLVLSVVLVVVIIFAIDRFRYRKLRKQIKKAAKQWCEECYKFHDDFSIKTMEGYLYKVLFQTVKPQYKALKGQKQKVYLSRSQPAHLIASFERRMDIKPDCISKRSQNERLEITLERVRFVPT